MVTHNANLAVACDAEHVIVCSVECAGSNRCVGTPKDHAAITPDQQACNRPLALCAAVLCRMDHQASFAIGEP